MQLAKAKMFAKFTVKAMMIFLITKPFVGI